MKSIRSRRCKGSRNIANLREAPKIRGATLFARLYLDNGKSYDKKSPVRGYTLGPSAIRRSAQIGCRTNSRPPAPSVAVLDDRRRGSTTNVALNAVAVGVSNAATGAHGALRIVGVGSTLHVADCV